MIDSRIEWCDDTANPWWGCQRVSPACEYCYAEGLDARFRPGGATHWGPSAPRLLRLDAFKRDLVQIGRRAIRGGRPRRVFVASMCDVFEDRVDLVEPRRAVWDTLTMYSDYAKRLPDGRPLIVPMLLTKRPDVMARWAEEHGWPRDAWAGCTVEDQQRADARIPWLLQVPARVRFVSCEPLLGPVRLDHVLHEGMVAIDALGGRCGWPVPHAAKDTDGHPYPRLSWAISGGESGPRARPSHPDWFLSLRDQCVAAGVPFHFKQWGQWAESPHGEDEYSQWVSGRGRFEDAPDSVAMHLHRAKKAAGRGLDGRTWDEVPEVTP